MWIKTCTKKKWAIIILLFTLSNINAATKTSTGNGNWSSNGTWSPSGVPSSGDSVVIQSGHTVTMNTNTSCTQLTVIGTLNFSGNKKLTLSGRCTVNGTCNVTNGNLVQNTSGAVFTLGAGSVFYWDPQQNNSAHSTIWTNSVEAFSATSTITIKKWYNFSIPLGSVVTGNFGNLTLWATSGSSTATWSQANYFESHQIQGTLTIEQGYIILDETNAITNTSIGNIILNRSSSYLDFVDGTRSSPFVVNTGNVTINDGWFDMLYYSGTGTCTFNVSGNFTNNSGIFYGADYHDAVTTVNITGDLTNNGGNIYGSSNGTGNTTFNVGGNLYNNKTSGVSGEIYGIVDGTGNSIITVSGNLTNSGYFDLVWNTGVSGVANGNGTLTVGGAFTQSQGDFRGIYNLTTFNAGVVAITMNSINYSGGIFMAHYACHTGGGTNTFTVTNDVTIAFGGASDQFKGNGLNSLSSTVCNSNLVWNIGGNLTVSGNGSAEFSSAASQGTETFSLGGNLIFSGGTGGFNHSSSGSGHSSTLTFGGNVTVESGGTLYLSNKGGALSATIAGNFSQTGGTAIVKGDIGAGTLNVLGDFTVSGGNFYNYYNSSTPSTEAATVSVQGAFTHSGGHYWFDNNDLSTAAHILNIYGSSYTLSNNVSIKRDGTTSSTGYGIINFARAGTITYNRSDNNHDVLRVKQYIKSGTTLDAISDLQISAHGIASTDNLTIESGGILDLNANQMKFTSSGTYAGFIIKNNGRLRTMHTGGFYDDTNTSAIRRAIDYYLEPSSIVEYYGTADIPVNGYGYGSATTANDKYGILDINISNTASRAYLATSNNVRTQLVLSDGQLDLNSKTLTIESGAETAITRTTGYIKSETNAAVNPSIVTWQSMTSGAHVFPFGVSSSDYIPVTFNPTSGAGGNVSISTRSTSPANTPFPTGVSSMNSNGTSAATSGVIDRWWNITATGFTANLILSYRASENTTSSPTSSFGLQAFSSGNWSAAAGSGTGVTTGVGSISASGVSTFGPVVIVSSTMALPIELLYFNAKLLNEKVELKWATAEEKDNDYFNIERSADCKSWTSIEQIKGAGNSTVTLTYSTIDNNPLKGKSYYRLKQTDFNGEFSYSPIRIINLSQAAAENVPAVSIERLGPNPFTTEFNLSYNVKEAGEAELYIVGVNGQVIKNEKMNVEEGVNYYDFKDEQGMPAGNYIITILMGKDKVSQKIVKR